MGKLGQIWAWRDCAFLQGDAGTLDLLLQHSADVNAADSVGRSAQLRLEQALLVALLALRIVRIEPRENNRVCNRTAFSALLNMTYSLGDL